MTLDVLFTPAGLTLAEVQGRTVFVIDVLRATTSMCAALSSGAKAILPVAATEEALRLAQTLGSDDVLLAGERNCTRIEGFHLGNSPLEMTEAAVRGKTLILTTTNGTKALLACQGAAAVYPACAGNLSLAAERAREALERDEPVLLVCAGREGAVLAGRRVHRGTAGVGHAGRTLRAPRPQRLRSRGPRPRAPVRRPLGAAAPPEPRRPRAHPTRLRQRCARRSPAGRLPGASPLPGPTRDAGDCRRMTTPTLATSDDSRRRRLGALTALVAGLFLGLTLLPVGLTGPVGGYIGHALWQLLGAGALGIPLLGIGLALAGFDRLGGLDMKRSAVLIVGLSVLVPYVVGVLTQVTPADLDMDVAQRTIAARSVGLVPGFLAETIAGKIGVAGAVLVGFLALSALTLVTFAWHPLQRLEAGRGEPAAVPFRQTRPPERRERGEKEGEDARPERRRKGREEAAAEETAGVLAVVPPFRRPHRGRSGRTEGPEERQEAGVGGSRRGRGIGLAAHRAAHAAGERGHRRG